MKEMALLFFAFIKVGILGYGGGQSIIPLIQVEVVDNYRWMSISEFIEALAMANSLPGPLTVKMSLFIGYRVAGIAGAGISMVGLLLPCIVLMFTLSIFYLNYKNLPLVKGLLAGVKPVVIALLALVIYNIFPTSISSWHAGLIALVSFCLMAFGGVHPAILVVGGALLGMMVYR